VLGRVSQQLATHRHAIMNNGSNSCTFDISFKNQTSNFKIAPQLAGTGAIFIMSYRWVAIRCESRSKLGGGQHFTDSLHPTPHTLHPTPYTPHPTPYTLHPTPHTLHPTPFNLQARTQMPKTGAGARPYISLPTGVTPNCSASSHSTAAGRMSDTRVYDPQIRACVTQLKAQGPARTCNERKEEE